MRDSVRGACSLSRILSVSRNPRFFVNRNDALALAGYGVASPKEPEDALVLFAQESFDAVMIGDSVERETRESLIAVMRDKRRICPLCLLTAGQRNVRGTACRRERRCNPRPHATRKGTRQQAAEGRIRLVRANSRDQIAIISAAAHEPCVLSQLVT
jgi:hypothetical protein